MGIGEFLKQLTDPQSILHYGGLGLLLFVIFAETGLFVGFFLPGDSLVFIAGMFCYAQPDLLGVGPVVLILLMSTAAVMGNIAGYWFGKKTGTPLFQREDSFFFKKRHLELTRDFYDKHGAKTIVLGRFLPYIRTFAPILAGVIEVNFRSFLLQSVVGAFLWIGSLSIAGFFLGSYSWVRDHIEWIVLGLIGVTTLPMLFALLRRRKSNRH